MHNKHKTCTKCGETKPLDGFSKDRSKKDGLNSRCKDCLRRYREDNLERILEGKRRYYEENRDFAKEGTNATRSNYQELSAMLATVPPHTPWTPEEEALLMADNGLTLYQKAVELGRTYKSCSRRHELRTKST